MPISQSDKKRAESHENPDVTEGVSKYDIIFSTHSKVSLGRILHGAITDLKPFAFFPLLLLFLTLYLLSKNSALLLVVYYVPVSTIFTFLAELILNPYERDSYKVAKSFVINFIQSIIVCFTLLCAITVLFPLIVLSLLNLLVLIPYLLFTQIALILVTIILFYMSVRYILASTARMNIIKRKKLNTFDLSWHMIDKSFIAFFAFKLMFNILIVAVFMLTLLYSASIPIVSALIIVLSALTLLYENAKTNAFDTLMAETRRYHPEA